jgi:hypothetical protein
MANEVLATTFHQKCVSTARSTSGESDATEITQHCQQSSKCCTTRRAQRAPVQKVDTKQGGEMEREGRWKGRRDGKRSEIEREKRWKGRRDGERSEMEREKRWKAFGDREGEEMEREKRWKAFGDGEGEEMESVRKLVLAES